MPECEHEWKLIDAYTRKNVSFMKTSIEIQVLFYCTKCAKCKIELPEVVGLERYAMQQALRR